ncbi:UDP-N-acetylmuramoyl-L-alanine--D-glutamate ligase [Alteromonas sp. C1M14]|uniref:UDP-N-acetylmuramoyl-L-alanine--D-glutamate ligase n=1 Tax=Alteromonas sp. C1M14 TaxID=2841567 RepID=UPI001C085616|nr:UDP-N-acetylmuramoyl-L-alanine--D-glutamate ligase [Alteromonas sp. C1M14]MBU2979417.1 UDP-N-acetylmuramoyl-L-alanine--D-glutamate ligase [Alteromonas sp. C1M14]
MDEILAKQRIVVAGLGLTGQSVVRFLTGLGVTVSVWDTRAEAVVPSWITNPVTLGRVNEDFWTDIDMLILSPGISPSHPGVHLARQAGVEVMGDIELFARLSRTPLFGITGSNGKTTVTLLLTHILKTAGLKACAAGNVGQPVLDTLGEQWDALVLELSSFQLETTSSLSLKGGTILNISDDHLDRHGTIGDYAAAKQRIFLHCEHALVWRDHQECFPASPVSKVTGYGVESSNTEFGFSNNCITWQGKPVLNMVDVQLVGTHNVLNIQAALGLSLLAGVSMADACEGVKSFVPAPHRCVQISTRGGVHWIDDSKATNVGATLAALEGIGKQKTGKLFLIAGGDGKGADLSVLQSALLRYVDVVITLGKNGPDIAELFHDAHQVDDLPAAVNFAATHASSKDTVLLSPACASIDMFENYQHRATVFADAIAKVEL